MRHTTRMQYREIMWAEMKPDCYDGPNCDQQRPDWTASAEGDKDVPGSVGSLIELEASTFPPGTKVVISVPECPECTEQADICACGFDWEQWTYGEYA